MSKKLLTWVSIAAAAVVVIGSGWTAWNYKANTHEFQELKASYQLDKTTQRHNAVQERLWSLENMCRNTPSQCSAQVKAEMRHLRLELEELKRELSKKGS